MASLFLLFDYFNNAILKLWSNNQWVISFQMFIKLWKLIMQISKRLNLKQVFLNNFHTNYKFSITVNHLQKFFSSGRIFSWKFLNLILSNSSRENGKSELDSRTVLEITFLSQIGFLKWHKIDYQYNITKFCYLAQDQTMPSWLHYKHSQ